MIFFIIIMANNMLPHSVCRISHKDPVQTYSNFVQFFSDRNYYSRLLIKPHNLQQIKKHKLVVGISNCKFLFLTRC